MKNYTLRKLLVARSGLVFVSNRYGQRWIEIRVNGRLWASHTISDPVAELKKQDRVLRGLLLIARNT